MIVSAFLLLFSQNPIPADQPPQPAAESAVLDEDEDEAEKGAIVVEGERAPEPKLVCRRERTTGTGIAKKVCRTVEQIAADARNARVFHSDIRSAQDADAASRFGNVGPK